VAVPCEGGNESQQVRIQNISVGVGEVVTLRRYIVCVRF
jgi:hypothetical protein